MSLTATFDKIYGRECGPWLEAARCEAIKHHLRYGHTFVDIAITAPHSSDLRRLRFRIINGEAILVP